MNLITALQSGDLRSIENYVNKKLRCRCGDAAQWLARQAQATIVESLIVQGRQKRPG
jgi:hypothetical protein